MRHVEPSTIANYVLQFINQTRQNIFLTGKAGTGKTTLLHHILETTHKNVAVVAPTGIAALNAKGVTIHSMFQLPFAAFLPVNTTPPHSLDTKFETKATLGRHFKMNATRKNVIKQLELLVIDEVSMLRPDLLDAIDYMLKSIRKSKEVFGGVQVLFIGDLLQLPPVIKEQEWSILKQYYHGKYFFHSQAISKNNLIYIELDKIFRQNDEDFIAVLNNLRTNSITTENIAFLNQYVNPDFSVAKYPGYITLTTHNFKADKINQESLQNIDAKEFTFKSEIVGDFPEKIFPVDDCIRLKVGTQVMFVKNDTNLEKRYYNGKIGVISKLTDNEIFVKFDEENSTIEVEKYEWQNIRYKINETTKEIEEDVLGTFVQYPLKLAWAITVHKSQGLTFDKAAIDVSQVFQPGQAYVAFSRLRSLNGLILLSKLQLQGFDTDVDVISFSAYKSPPEALAQQLKITTQQYIVQYLSQCFNWQETLQSWRNLHFETKSNDKKNDIISWAKEQEQILEKAQHFAINFNIQIQNLFAKESPLSFVQERVDAAFDYFFPIIEAQYQEIVVKLIAIQNTKKLKIWFNAVSDLEEAMCNHLILLYKSKKIIGLLSENQSLMRDNLHAKEIKELRNTIYEKAKQQFRAAHNNLIEPIEIAPKKSKAKTKKEAKKPTTEETLELWLQKFTVEEIAEKRKFTVQTIYNHLAKLIQQEKIAITDVLSEDKIKALQSVFQQFGELAISEIKEKTENQFTWEELKLYKATIQV